MCLNSLPTLHFAESLQLALGRLTGGSPGAIKGLSFGVWCWAVMGLVFFPLLELGLFATGIGLGVWPALFSLAMLLTFRVVMGVVYDGLNS
jgi:hypothetical protein